jgi:hypothetical protein
VKLQKEIDELRKMNIELGELVTRVSMENKGKEKMI